MLRVTKVVEKLPAVFKILIIGQGEINTKAMTEVVLCMS